MYKKSKELAVNYALQIYFKLKDPSSKFRNECRGVLSCYNESVSHSNFILTSSPT